MPQRLRAGQQQNFVQPIEKYGIIDPMTRGCSIMKGLGVRAAVVALATATTVCTWSPSAFADETTALRLAQSTRDTAAIALQGAQDLAQYALSLIGVDYKYGGDTPESGLDCSGLVRYVFQEMTGVTLPRTSKELARLGDKIAVADLKPGDLVFFNTRKFPFSHVGIFLGDGRFIHAPRRGHEVEIVTLDGPYWKRRFDGARRLMGVLPELIMPTAHAQPLLQESAPEPDVSGDDVPLLSR
jgi:cell wall-associated NlpC family hydrolase